MASLYVVLPPLYMTFPSVYMTFPSIYMAFSSFYMVLHQLDMAFSSLYMVLSPLYMAFPSLGSNCSLLYDYLLIRPEAPISALEKGCLNFRKHLSIGVKSSCSRNFCKLSGKTSMLESFSSILACLPGSFPETFYPVENLWSLPL